MSLKLLCNYVLSEAYEKARQEGLDEDFIDLLKNELNHRDLLDLDQDIVIN
ncbi:MULTISPECIES: sporulation histidine kinase inhibitor Sda [Lentibacillus]|uniref:sporulation histidine kinase inhibitor Sda n=1 Tax=Lentibacillus TaxID=175304 RepID=UPI00030CBD4E|nr:MULTISPECIES: sporulation histidine kinase inhibitor Sda [Lentibacillus]